MKYRIKTEPEYDGEPRFVPERKVLGLFWWPLSMLAFADFDRAKEQITDDLNRRKFKREVVAEFES